MDKKLVSGKGIPRAAVPSYIKEGGATESKARVKERADGRSSRVETKISSAADWRLALCCQGN